MAPRVVPGNKERPARHSSLSASIDFSSALRESSGHPLANAHFSISSAGKSRLPNSRAIGVELLRLKDESRRAVDVRRPARSLACFRRLFLCNCEQSCMAIRILRIRLEITGFQCPRIRPNQTIKPIGISRAGFRRSHRARIRRWMWAIATVGPLHDAKPEIMRYAIDSFSHIRRAN